MPIPKSVRRAAREGGNVEKAPTGTESSSTPSPKPVGVGGDAVVAECQRLAAVTVSEQEPIPQESGGLFTFKVNSAKLKENKNGPYRSITGRGADGKLYWAPLDASQKPVKGQMITLEGEEKGIFGGEDGKPSYHKILGPNYFPEVVSIWDKSEAPEKPAQVSSADADGLLKTLETLVKAHGIGKILTVLGEIS